MKKILLTVFAIVSFLFIAQTISAGGIIVYSNGLTYEIKEKLPEDITISGSHVDFGISYEQFSLMWIPVWNYGSVEYAFIDKANKMIYDVTEEDADFLKEEFGIDISKSPQIGFWNAFGGKLIFGAIIAFFIWSSLAGKKEEKEKEEKELQEIRDIQEAEERRKQLEQQTEEEDEEEEDDEDDDEEETSENK